MHDLNDEFLAAANLDLVEIPGGKFLMGSPDDEEGRTEYEGPVHEVTVPPFRIGRYPVTNEEYGRFLVARPDHRKLAHGDARWFSQLRQPVVGADWDDAQAFAKWAGCRLPSEAEWEYACRAGTATRFYNGDDEKGLDAISCRGALDDATHPVGRKEPNAFGLFDMLGNVWEWVEDDWHDDYLEAPGDGRPWVHFPRKKRRVVRGGAWGVVGSRDRRCASRSWHVHELRLPGVGFRVVSPLSS